MKERKGVHLEMGVNEHYMIVLGLGKRAVEMTWTEAMDMSRIMDFMAVAAAMGVGAQDETIQRARDHASDAAMEAAKNLVEGEREQ